MWIKHPARDERINIDAYSIIELNGSEINFAAHPLAPRDYWWEFDSLSVTTQVWQTVLDPIRGYGDFFVFPHMMIRKDVCITVSLEDDDEGVCIQVLCLDDKIIRIDYPSMDYAKEIFKELFEGPRL